MASSETQEKLSPEEIEKRLKEIKEEGNKRAGGKKFELTYDAFGESLEPLYYWTLDFLREDRGYAVEKTADYFSAAEASGWYGEMGVRRTAMEKRAMEILATINAIIKSMINLVYDLREFDLRFQYYDGLKSKDKSVQRSSEQSLKQIWLTEVDMKKGAAAINMMVQNLNFIGLRDALMAAQVVWGKDREETKSKSIKQAEQIDVSDMVKRPLLARLGEFVDWFYLSENELRKRYNIEKVYLKSQIASLKLYTKWARPYLIATKRLMPTEIKDFGAEYGLSAAELVTPFDIMHLYLEIFGTKEVKSYGKIPESQFKDIPSEDKIICGIEVKFGFRSSPGITASTQPGGHYTARGKVIIKITPYILFKKELDELKSLEDKEVLQFIDAMTYETMKAIEEDIKEYAGDEKETKKEAKKKEEVHPLVKPIKWTQAQIKAFKDAFTKLGIKPPKKTYKWEIGLLNEAAKVKIADDATKVYESYKKAHKMLTW